jgi:hypothetical protein
MRLRAACLLLALGLAACQGEESTSGLSALAKSCQSEPTQLCFQIEGKKVVLLPGDGKLSVSVDRQGIFVRFWAREGSYGVHFAPPSVGQIVPGVYRDTRPAIYNQPETPLLSVDSPHDTCSGPGGFVLHDVAFDDTGTKVERLDVSFEITGCGSNRDQVSQGRVRWNAAVPLTGLKGRLARFLRPRRPERPTAPATLRLETVNELCAIDDDPFLCLQGNAGAWTAAGRRRVFTRRKGVSLWNQANTRGGVEFSASTPDSSGEESSVISLFSRRGVLFLPGLYQTAAGETIDGPGPYLSVGNCNLARRGPDRFYVYEADLGIGDHPKHFLADFEARCGANVVVGRVALGSKLLTKARAEAAGDPEKLQAALSRLLDVTRKRIAATPRPVVSLETVDSFCPDRQGTFLCFRSTAGEVMGQGRSLDVGPPLAVSVFENMDAITVTLPQGNVLVQIAPPKDDKLRSGSYYAGTRCDNLFFGNENPFLTLVLRDPSHGAFGCRSDFHGRYQVVTLDRREDGSLQNIAFIFELKTWDGAPVAGRLRVTGVDENNVQAAAAARAAEWAAASRAQSAPVAPQPPPVPEADARCSADGRTFERRGDVWMESGTERQTTVTLTRGQDPKFDLMALRARIWTALNLGPRVRTYVDGKVTEILQGDGYPKDPFAGVRCEVFGKVRLPRRTAEMGSALDAQLRQDGKRGLHVGARFLVGRDGKVSELLTADGLPEEYRPLLLQDLQKMTYMPASLDGRPVPVVQSGTLTY